MGMQQIILLALAVIIVGIATVYGIEAFTLNRTRSNMDAIVQDLVVMGSEAQQWKARPAQFGGQGSDIIDDPLTPEDEREVLRGDVSNYTGFDFEVIGRCTACAAILNNMNGEFEILQADPLQVRGCNAAEGNSIVVEVTGIRDEEVTILNATRITGDPDSVPCGAL